MFRKRRLRLRQFVLPVAAIAAVYGILSLLSSPEASVPASQHTASAGFVTAAPNEAAHFASIENIAGNIPGSTAGNMKAAFSAAPAPASYELSDFARGENRPLVKPQQAAGAPVAEITPDQVPPAVAEKLAYIQKGIQNLLQAGTDLFVAERKLAVGRGDTLMDLLVRNDVSRADAYNAIQALSKVYDPRALNPGHEITVFFHKDPAVADPKFSGLQIQKDKISTVLVNLLDDG